MRIKKFLSGFLAAAVIAGYAFAPGVMPFADSAVVKANAATFDDLNQSGVFLQQPDYVSCTLYSATMLIRRAQICEGKSWTGTTPSSVGSVAWIEDAGLSTDFTYDGYRIVNYNFGDVNKTQRLLELLKDHPEGVMLYRYNGYGDTHMVLLTDYTDGVFYCADPASSASRRKLSDAYLVYSPDRATSYSYIVNKTFTIDDDYDHVVVPDPVDCPIENGVYMLKNVHSGLMMDVAGGKDADDTRLGVYESNGTAAQKFRFEHLGGGAYRIYAMCSSNGSNRVIDVNVGGNGYPDPGDYIDIWTVGGYDNCQIFNVVHVAKNKYVLELKADKNGVIGDPLNDTGTDLYLQQYNGIAAQQWYFCNESGDVITPSPKPVDVPDPVDYPVGDGVYTLKNVKSGLMMDVAGGKDADDTRLGVYENNGTAAQKFRFEHLGGGAYRIYAMCSSKGSNRVVDVNVGSNGYPDPGDYIDIWTVGGYDNCQIFNVVPVGSNKFVLELKADKNGVIGDPTSDKGDDLYLEQYTGSAAQQWYFCDENGKVIDPKPAPVKTALVYRLYNPVNQEHLFTTDANEVRVLVKDYGWNYEGSSWSAPATGTPVYRLYCSETNAHLFTSDTNERDTLLQNPVWSIDNDGKPLFYSAKSGIAIYRVYNGAIRRHLLTTNKDEYDFLVANGWNGEGVKFYCSALGDPEYPMP